MIRVVPNDGFEQEVPIPKMGTSFLLQQIGGDHPIADAVLMVMNHDPNAKVTGVSGSLEVLRHQTAESCSGFAAGAPGLRPFDKP